MNTGADNVGTSCREGDFALRARGLSKSFGAVRALADLDLDVSAGAVLGLLGENGAGKSTFIALASGAHRPSAGSIEIAGRAVELHSPVDGQRLGVQVVHQEPKLANELSIATNIYASKLSSGQRALALHSSREIRRRAYDHLDALGLLEDLPNLSTPAGRLTAAQRQLVAIAKALTSRPSLLFLDEPNSSLTRHETEKLWSTVRTMKEQGVAVVAVSHRLRELYEIVDRVAILRDGRKVGEGSTDDISIDQAVRLMAGTRRVDVPVGREASSAGREVLRLENVGNRHVRNINLTLHAGEIVGMAGLVGAGRSEIARAACGVDPALAGRIYLDGQAVRFRTPGSALRKGVIMTNEERRVGLFAIQNVSRNVTASVFGEGNVLGVIRKRRDRAAARRVLTQLSVKGAPAAPITLLSGGNQQKVLIGRALAASPKALLLDEPTHGIDVATKAEIYGLMRGLANTGIAILFISSELDELFLVADRIVVVRHGTIVADLSPTRDSEAIMAAALGEGSVDSGLAV